MIGVWKRGKRVEGVLQLELAKDRVCRDRQGTQMATTI